MDEGNITFDYGDKKVIANDDGIKTEIPSQPEQSEVKSKTKDHSGQQVLILIKFYTIR